MPPAWILAAWIAANSADLASTQYAIAHGAHEANPFVTPTSKVVTTAAGAVGLYQLQKRHPKIAWAIVLGTVVVDSYAVVRNMRNGLADRPR